MEKLWTTAEVARHLGITEPDVETLVREGRLTGYQLGGRFLRFQPAQVEALKGRVSPPIPSKPVARARDSWHKRLKEFVYFYDFYLISASLLAALVLYLIAAG